MIYIHYRYKKAVASLLSLKRVIKEKDEAADVQTAITLLVESYKARHPEPHIKGVQ